MHPGLRNYLCVTAAYWADTLTDGALRMLVLFHFYEQGYTAWQVASLFLFYEVFGIVTNFVGRWLGTRFGLKMTLYAGLGTQLAALSMLAFAPATWLTVPWVMVSQAFSGIAKDLTKMSSKSAVKLIAGDSEARLYKWVAILTGSKNALKGVGFFLGGLLLSVAGFQPSLLFLGTLVLSALMGALLLMRGGIGEASKTAKFSHMFSTNRAVNLLAAARVFLFGARDVWFVVALPVFLSSALGWKFWQAGAFMAFWIIGYGLVQAATPALIRSRITGKAPDGGTAVRLASVLTLIPAGIAVALESSVPPHFAVPGGLIVFGLVFALNSSVHSFLILSYADSKKVAQSVGFYYMANACGRLAGTILSGALYQLGLTHSPSRGLGFCLWASAGFLLLTALVSLALPTGAPSRPPVTT
jgi:MFS family permease